MLFSPISELSFLFTFAIVSFVLFPVKGAIPRYPLGHATADTENNINSSSDSLEEELLPIPYAGFFYPLKNNNRIKEDHKADAGSLMDRRIKRQWDGDRRNRGSSEENRKRRRCQREYEQCQRRGRQQERNQRCQRQYQSCMRG